MPYPRIVLVLKADLSVDDCIEFINTLTEKGEKKFQNLYVALPFSRLKDLKAQFPHSGITFGSTMLNSAKQGAFTTEIAAKMVKDAHGSFVLVGTSDERKVFGLSDADLEAKLTAASQGGLKPIYCVSSEHEDAKESLVRQLNVLKASHAAQPDPHPTLIYELPFITFKSYLPTKEELSEFKTIIQEALTTVFEGDAGKFRIIASLPSDLAGFSTLLESLPFDGASFTKFGVYPHAVHQETIKLFHVECIEEEEIPEAPVPEEPAPKPKRTRKKAAPEEKEES
jgi:triosephosphate isomerase